MTEVLGFRSFCAFPHGITSVYALLLGLSSCLLALSSTMGCYFVRVDFLFLNNSPEQIEDIDNELGGMTMGLVNYQDHSPGSSGGQCVSYSVEQMEDFDGVFRAARGFALLANILLGVGALILMMMSCSAVRSSVVTVLSGIILAGGICQGLTVMAYFSSFMCDYCQFFFGSGLALLGTITSMMAGAIVCHIPPAAPPRPQEDNDEHVENISIYKQTGRPPTPKHITGGMNTSNNLEANSTSSSDGEEDEFYIPETLTVYDTEVVLVLPDGSKQVIEPRVNVQSGCDMGCGIFSNTT